MQSTRPTEAKNNIQGKQAIHLNDEQFTAIRTILDKVFHQACKQWDDNHSWEPDENVSIYLLYTVALATVPISMGNPIRELFSKFAGVETGKPDPKEFKAGEKRDSVRRAKHYKIPLYIYSLPDFVSSLADYVEKNSISKRDPQDSEDIKKAFQTLFDLLQIQRAPLQIATKGGLWFEEQDAMRKLLTTYCQNGTNRFNYYVMYRDDSDPAVFDFEKNATIPSLQQDLAELTPAAPRKEPLTIRQLRTALDFSIEPESKEQQDTIQVKNKGDFILQLHSLFAERAEQRDLSGRLKEPEITHALAICFKYHPEFNQLIFLFMDLMRVSKPLAAIVKDYLIGMSQEVISEARMELGFKI